MRFRPVRPNIYLPVIRFGVLISDWKYILAVTLGVWLLIAAGIGGIGWALINGMRRQSWGAQLIFGAACLGFGGIVALWNEYANGRSPDLPAF